jgi:hypothetical protein
MPRNTGASALTPVSAPKTASPAVVWAWACSAAEIPEMATSKSLTTRVVLYLPWIRDRTALMFQTPAELPVRLRGRTGFSGTPVAAGGWRARRPGPGGIAAALLYPGRPASAAIEETIAGEQAVMVTWYEETDWCQ